MAISTYKVFLMKKDAQGTYEKVVDIKDFPDLGGTPEMLDTTTLSDRMKTSIPGIQSLDALEFTANYTKEDFKKVYALRDKEEEYAVWIGGTEKPGSVTPTGEDGKYEFKGKLDVYVKGGGVNEVVDMVITIGASTPVDLVEN
jgi:hypothetical protein